MCSRYTLIWQSQQVADHFGLTKIDDFPPRYNIAPGQPVGIVRQGLDHNREFALVRWGLLPGWVKDIDEFSVLVNARTETIEEKPSFRNAIKYRRCLFPANGFYEWKMVEGERQPFYVAAANDELFAMAGIWEHWMGADGSEIETAAILTTSANSDVARIHNRMPALIMKEDYEQWLDCQSGLAHEACSLLRPVRQNFFRLHKVASLVNSEENHGPRLLQPVGQQELF
jgi:putative SOS response-associated peptidase YedK